MIKEAVREVRSLLGGLLLVGGLGLLVLFLWKPDSLQAVRENWQDWVAGDAPAAEADPQHALHVLFVGNSHTHRNDMPDMVRRLARAAGERRRFQPVMEAPGGERLKDHWDHGRVAQLLDKDHWDYVVLQEQQQFLSFSRRQRARDTDPYARRLVAEVRSAEATPLFYQTWARKDGDRVNVPRDTYRAMQARIRQGYRDLAEELAVAVVPVGDAWEQALEQSPPLNLWDDDGYHPNRKGSYLAACMFYAVFYRRSPVGNPYTAGLAESEAKVLQEVAAATARR
jgi:hypothetical protein